jgi:hypothetical protein
MRERRGAEEDLAKLPPVIIGLSGTRWPAAEKAGAGERRGDVDEPSISGQVPRAPPQAAGGEGWNEVTFPDGPKKNVVFDGWEGRQTGTPTSRRRFTSSRSARRRPPTRRSGRHERGTVRAYARTPRPSVFSADGTRWAVTRDEF